MATWILSHCDLPIIKISGAADIFETGENCGIIIDAFKQMHPVGSCIIVFDGDNYKGTDGTHYCPFTELINALIQDGYTVYAFKSSTEDPKGWFAHNSAYLSHVDKPYQTTVALMTTEYNFGGFRKGNMMTYQKIKDIRIVYGGNTYLLADVLWSYIEESSKSPARSIDTRILTDTAENIPLINVFMSKHNPNAYETYTDKKNVVYQEFGKFMSDTNADLKAIVSAICSLPEVTRGDDVHGRRFVNLGGTYDDDYTKVIRSAAGELIRTHHEHPEYSMYMLDIRLQGSTPLTLPSGNEIAYLEGIPGEDYICVVDKRPRPPPTSVIMPSVRARGGGKSPPRPRGRINPGQIVQLVGSDPPGIKIGGTVRKKPVSQMRTKRAR